MTTTSTLAGGVDHQTAIAAVAVGRFPTTRYQGSKRRIADTIVRHVNHLDYETVLDAFGGTGAVSYAFKSAGKAVTYNDILAFNHQIGTALIENDHVQLDDDVIARIGARPADTTDGDFIARTFKGIYFTPEENEWLDVAVVDVRRIECRHARAIAWFALCQSALAKRPYNLFHRANLYMRLADVKRGFGNKASWDRPFPVHFRTFAREANRAVIDGSGRCRAVRRDVFDLPTDFDLVYIDTPYVNARGVGVSYQEFYHFLEGLVRYDEWPALVDGESKHRRFKRADDPWRKASRMPSLFEQLVDHFRRSTLVVSYRSDGVPPIDDLRRILTRNGRCVDVISAAPKQYALSTNTRNHEMLLIASRG